MVYDSLRGVYGVTVIMFDHMNAIKYKPNYQKETLELKQVLQACKGQSPMQRFAHFTGR